MALDVKTKISAGRYLAMQQAPYMAAAIYKMVFRPVPLGSLSKRGTLAMTEKAVVLYEEAAVQRWSEVQLAAVMVHELMHLVRQHGKRCGDRDKKKWNRSADREINDDLVAMRLPLPDVPCMPEQIKQPKGQTAEEYYPHEPDDPDDGGGGGGGAGAGNCGTCASHRHGEPPDPNSPEQQHGQGVDRSEAELDNMRNQVAEAVNREAGKGRGSIPRGLQRWAKKHLEPAKIPWQAKLSRLIRCAVEMRAGAVDYRYSQTSRRQWGLMALSPNEDACDIPIIPGLVEPVPTVGVGLDTSLSMRDSEIVAGVRETVGIMKALQAKVQFVACDAAVHAVKQVSTVEELLGSIKGGGGTDFHPMFEAIDKMQPRPEVFVVITDGDGPAPVKPPPNVHIIWLLVGVHRCMPHAGNYGSGKHPEYGTWLEIDDDDKHVIPQ